MNRHQVQTLDNAWHDCTRSEFLAWQAAQAPVRIKGETFVVYEAPTFGPLVARFVSNKDEVLTADQFNDAPMPGDMSMGELRDILLALVDFGWLPEGVEDRQEYRRSLAAMFKLATK